MACSILFVPFFSNLHKLNTPESVRGKSVETKLAAVPLRLTVNLLFLKYFRNFPYYSFAISCHE